MNEGPNLIKWRTRTENKEHFYTYGQRKIMDWSEEQRQGIKGLTNVDQTWGGMEWRIGTKNKEQF
jgi:hypothetical protein